MPVTIYVATSNLGKLRDFSFAVGEQAQGKQRIPVMRPLPDLLDIPPPLEEGLTFQENAVTKAVYYSAYRLREIVISDDSGLEVEGLGGAPGVRSARYAQDREFSPTLGRTVDQLNNECLLRELANSAGAARRGRYRCALAAARDGAILATSMGVIEGWILQTEIGTSGFGYDPLFFVPDLGCTMAEVDSSRRTQISHRGRALRAMLAVLET